jgi:MFS family permease
MASTVERRSDTASDEKKVGDEYLENNNNIKHIHTIENLPDPDAGLSDEERAAHDKTLLRKLDLKLIPWLSFLYRTSFYQHSYRDKETNSLLVISFLDRTNIGNAKVDGLQKDLNMTDGQYNASLTIFFVSYSVFEPLTNVLLKKMRPSIFLPLIMILWGICMTCMGLVHNAAGLMTARWWLGVAEAGLFPGVNYYLSCWYRRSEFGIRAAVFFSAAALAGSFGGLLAAGIAQMKGVGGKPGWAWIFVRTRHFSSLVTY